MAGAFDVAVDTDLKEVVQQSSNRAYITKSAACSLHLLLNVKDKDKLRHGVQGELQALRKVSLKEADVLPPLLLQKMQLALAM
eukprot:3311589-Amphidinium_carterae.6